MINFSIPAKSEQEQYYDEILKMLTDADDEFFPPLSARNSTTQSDLLSGEKSENGVLSYFEELKKQKFMVATEEGRLLAFVSFKENYTNDEIKENNLPNIYLSTLIVKKDARGRGITSKMYEKLFDAYKDVNVFTRTWSTNIAHIKILEKFNFKTFRVLKDDRAEGVDTVYFKKSCRNFVGRKEYIDIFRDKYVQLCRKPYEEEKVFALSFSGPGGIGKTWLKDELIEEVSDEYGDAPKYAEIEMEEKDDWIKVLRRLAGQLYLKYKYDFSLFVMAYNILMNKTGELQNIIRHESEKGARVNFDTAVDCFFEDKIKKRIDWIKLGYMLLGGRKRFAKEAKEMEDMSIEELRENLPNYFADDMNRNYSVGDRPLIVFIDTYENLVSEVENRGNPLYNDKKLRDNNGIFKRINNVFWVICGREELKWASFDKSWEEDLSQNMLSELSFEESDKYLRLSGFEDEQLRRKIYRLTNGMPLYLLICKNKLEMLRKEGKTPEISDFGDDREELFSRFIKGMSGDTRDVFFLLGAIGKWTDELIEKVVKKYSYSVYNMVKNLSVVKTAADGSYMMNRTVSEVLTDKCPEQIQREAGNFLLDTYFEEMKRKNFDSPDYIWCIASVLRGVKLTCKNRTSFLEFYKNEVQEILHRFINEKYHSIDFSMFNSFLDYAKAEKGDLLYAYAVWFESHFLCFDGRNNEAEKGIEEVCELFKNLLGEEHPHTREALTLKGNILHSEGKNAEAEAIKIKAGEDIKSRFEAGEILSAKEINHSLDTIEKTSGMEAALKYCEKVYAEIDPDTADGDTLDFMHNYAFNLHNSGFYRKALEIKRVVYKKRCEVNENHPHTLYALLSLADTVTKAGDVNEAIDLYNEAIEKFEKKFGEEHSATLVAKGNLGFALCVSGQSEKALGLLNELIEKSVAVFGENHRETLNTMHNKSVCLYWNGDYMNAYKNEALVYEKRRMLLGDKHRETIDSISVLSMAECRISKNKAAIDKQKYAIEMYKELLGENAFETLLAMRYLGQVYEALEEYKDGYFALKDALQVYSKVYGERNPLTKNIATGMLTMLVNRKDVPVNLIKSEVQKVTKRYNLK